MRLSSRRTSTESTWTTGSSLAPSLVMVMVGMPMSAPRRPLERGEDQLLAGGQAAKVVEAVDLCDPQVVRRRSVDLAAQQRQRVAVRDHAAMAEIGRR